MQDGQAKGCCITNCQNAGWWATLVVAVIAVPCFGIIAAMMWGSKGIGEIIVFIVACWLCTWLGMRLMKDPRMEKTFDINKNPE